MQNKIYSPSYKVRRLGSGLYSVEFLNNGKAYDSMYIQRIIIGSRGFYVIPGHPYYPTLRDAIFALVA